MAIPKVACRNQILARAVTIQQMRLSRDFGNCENAILYSNSKNGGSTLVEEVQVLSRNSHKQHCYLL